ncbi:TetR/AcrR family transcriptional regulator [Rufibacter sediminis]|uniref:TetR/AcrR family transcriptional regulator n=1 Tax=Rufibacter sediminis TaxID=2762756 RepID=A0ABR6VWC1_9BACT|nr:TetR/AcrR family transcriptional regulator [Rufibacter sediminis]MBC3541245.1 TetR/AcrR family transcriptional regulator [Rufibacter sediminis]
MSFRETILNEALVIFEQKGIEAISTEELLELLDISRGTLHGIAATKRDLVQHCINHSLKVRQAEVEQTMAATNHPLEAFLQLLQLSVEEVRSFCPAFVQDLRDYYPRSWARLELFMRALSRDYLQPLLEECIAAGYLQQDLPPEMVVRLFLNQLQGLLNPQLFPASAFDYQQLFKIVVVYHLRGCATPLGQAQIEAYTYKAMMA